MTLPAEAQAIVRAFEGFTGLSDLTASVKTRSDGQLLIVDVAPIERFYRALQATYTKISEDNPFRDRVSFHRSEVKNWLTRPETRLFERFLSEGSTIGKQNLGADFFERYIPSGAGYEDAIIARSNHLVCGRRGTGKSSLLLYAYGRLQDSSTCIWLTMQRYEGRGDWACAADILLQLLHELKPGGVDTITTKLSALAESSDTTSEAEVRRAVPSVATAIGHLATQDKPLYIFLDDFHVLAPRFQPSLCSILYGCTRDNRAFLKISGVERFTHLWESSTGKGLQDGQDIQKLSLDHNLEVVETAKKHIEEILDRQASYCGIDRISSLCSSSVIDRLVWLAAGVPRDAISAFSKAIAQSRIVKANSVTLTGLNAVASLTTEEKVRVVKEDAQAESVKALKLLEDIKDFCIKIHKINAFLVHIDDDNPRYQRLLQLADLRLVHVLHRGLTPDRAADRYAAFLLDYGFYVGTRKARSVHNFQEQTANPSAKDLRRLPRFSLLEGAPQAAAARKRRAATPARKQRLKPKR